MKVILPRRTPAAAQLFPGMSRRGTSVLFFNENGQMVRGPVTVTFNSPDSPCLESRTPRTDQVTVAVSPTAFGSNSAVIWFVKVLVACPPLSGTSGFFSRLMKAGYLL
jgi:hypothetical protein